MFAFKKLSMLFLALVILAATLGVSAQPAAAATCTQYHTVKRGETLYSIGLQYGVSWRTLAEINNLANPRLIYAGTKLCVSTTSGTTPVTTPSGRTPTFRIVSVAADRNVTIETANFPANDSFAVTMGAFGTRGVNGIRVATTNSGNGGKFSATYNIPDALKGSNRIAIRLESPSSGHFSYNWFYNNTTGSGTGGVGDGTTTPGYSGIPIFSIAAVVRDSTVTIRTNNFPAKVQFDVLMGEMGTRGINGIKVATIDSGNGGSFTQTFNIPNALMGSRRIAIRLENKTGLGYFAYNWFYNNTAN